MLPGKEHPEEAAAQHRGPKGSGVLAPALDLAISTLKPRGPQTCPWSHRAGTGLHKTTPALCPRPGLEAQRCREEGHMGGTGARPARAVRTRPEARLAAGLQLPPPTAAALAHLEEPRAPPPRPLTLPAHNPRACFVSRPWGKAVTHSSSIQRPAAAVYFLRNNGFFLVSIPQMKKQIQPL